MKENIRYSRRARRADRAATVTFYVVAGLFLALLAAITIYLLVRGALSFIPKYMGFGTDGLGVEIFNTLYMVLLSLLISAPLGIFAGIYMAEYARQGKLTAILRVCIETLSSLPSIVVGLFGFLVFVIMTHTTWNMLAGILALSILCVPLMTRTTEDGIREIPSLYKEGSYGIGATKWQTIVHVLLPAASPRIVTGIILAAGRSFGEAAALIYTSGLTSDVDFHNWNPFSITSPLSVMRTCDTIAVRIWYLKSFALIQDKYAIADMAAAVLILLVLAFNLGSRAAASALERKMTGEAERVRRARH